MTSFSYIELDVIYSRCQCLRVAYLFLFLIDMGSCDSHFIAGAVAPYMWC